MLGIHTTSPLRPWPWALRGSCVWHSMCPRSPSSMTIYLSFSPSLFFVFLFLSFLSFAFVPFFMVSFRIEKPGAVKLARAPMVEITRTLDHFKNKAHNAYSHPPALLEVIETECIPSVPPNPLHYAYLLFYFSPFIELLLLAIILFLIIHFILFFYAFFYRVRYLALGSNLGDKVKTIVQSLDTLRTHGKVISTAHLYQTPPAYITDQPPFVNTVCLVFRLSLFSCLVLIIIL